MIQTLAPITRASILPSTATSSRKNFCRSSVPAAAPPNRKAGGSHYEVLRVKTTASPVEIKAAYRDLAKVYHPDSSRSDGQDFIEICEAYSTLSDPATRAVYDLTLAVGSGRTVGIGSGFYRRWETDQCW